LAIIQGTCVSFKVELLKAIHDFQAAGDTFKIALYDADANLSENTTAYSTTNEISGTGYSAGGETLTSVDPTSSGTVAYGDFENVTWSSSNFTARGALIYNSSKANRAVAVLDFGTNKTSGATGEFTVTFPVANRESAIVRVS
jgi:hypothetical protein